jgi:hypothetical protein
MKNVIFGLVRPFAGFLTALKLNLSGKETQTEMDGVLSSPQLGVCLTL